MHCPEFIFVKRIDIFHQKPRIDFAEYTNNFQIEKKIKNQRKKLRSLSKKSFFSQTAILIMKTFQNYRRFCKSDPRKSVNYLSKSWRGPSPNPTFQPQFLKTQYKKDMDKQREMICSEKNSGNFHKR